MGALTIILWITVVVLTLDAAAEIGLVAATIAWLNNHPSQLTYINYGGPTYLRYWPFLPHILWRNHVYLNIAVGAIIFVLIGVLGIAALTLRKRQSFASSTSSKIVYHLWLLFTLCSTALTLAALIYTYVLEHMARNQLAANGSSTYTTAYTPRTWFSELLAELYIRPASEQLDIVNNLQIMEAWQINLIPLFILSFLVATFAVVEAVIARSKANKLRSARKIEG
ncbi:hypothetical protein AMS68_006528 [Peltaster fructicola]|uniref:DUF3533 domain-containing protein n=1 Tax=Peltaster fructicola TaxID=286661 RepID=A0A6H0Y262_9PEZI|nr:hypothetical protein AMS68_006528 [Peltaster fructicola]